MIGRLLNVHWIMIGRIEKVHWTIIGRIFIVKVWKIFLNTMQKFVRKFHSVSEKS